MHNDQPTTTKVFLDVLNRIRQQQPNFSPAQRQVAAYVLDNYHLIPFLSISSLAENIGVSNNSVIKFCNQLGYAKFAEFKRLFAEHAHEELITYNKNDESSLFGNEHSYFSRAMEDDIFAIQSTLSDPVNQENLPKLLNMMGKASHIYITGGRVSSATASYFACCLRLLGLRAHEISSGIGDYWDRLRMATKDDLIIAISLPRYTGEVVEALKRLRERNIPIVLLTDTGLSPAHPYADLVLYCTVRSDYYLPSTAGYLSLFGAICRAINHKYDVEKYQHQLDQMPLDGNPLQK